MASSTMLLLLFHSVVLFIVRETSVHAEPIKYTMTTFKNCVPGKLTNRSAYCCPPKQNLNGPIVDFVPKRDPSKPLKIKKALQCLSGTELETYTRNLQRGYELMQALPDDDPRSLFQQNALHCAYCTGSFAQDSTGIPTDIHVSWFFYPWHRYFLHFHEKILQKLLNSPTFILHFWNYDNSFEVPPPRGSRGGCFKPGHFFPPMYNDPSKATYLPNRSSRAFLQDLVADLGIPSSERISGIVTTLPSDETVTRNRATMHYTMITNALTWRDFLGRNYSVGSEISTNRTIRVGQWEFTHGSIHRWVGGSMSTPDVAASDPIFYAHHMSVDRMWTLWHTLAPGRTYPTDNADWMNAEFLFWDENKVLRRVKICDSLTTEAFGYRFQEVNDASWVLYNDTSAYTP